MTRFITLKWSLSNFCILFLLNPLYSRSWKYWDGELVLLKPMSHVFMFLSSLLRLVSQLAAETEWDAMAKSKNKRLSLSLDRFTCMSALPYYRSHKHPYCNRWNIPLILLWKEIRMKPKSCFSILVFYGFEKLKKSSVKEPQNLSKLVQFMT